MKAVDAEARSVTLEGPEGGERILKVGEGIDLSNVKTGELPGRCSLSVFVPTEPTAVLAKHNDTLTAAQSDVCLMHLCVAAWALGLSDDENLCNNGWHRPG